MSIQQTKVNCKNVFVLTVSVVFVFIASSVVYSHCQIPCGIYDDDMRFNMIAEHITTIEKSMKMIKQISSGKNPDMNQLVRWIQNKETHADKLSSIVTHYFLAQRIKPTKKTDAQKYQCYLTNLTLLHQMLVTTMKAKQTTDISLTKQLTELLANFKKSYYQKHKN